MPAGRRNVLGRNRISVRVLFSDEDYAELDRVAKLERTDVSTLIRRAVAHSFFIPHEGGRNRRRR